MARSLIVAAVSPPIEVGDTAANVVRLREALRGAASQGAQLIVLPELATCGYLFENRAEAYAAGITREDAAWADLAGALPDGVVAVVGYGEQADGELYNTAAVFTSRQRLGDYRKSHLWGAESALFRPGDTAGAVIDTPIGRLGVAICYDNEFPEVPRKLALAGADILALPVNWPLVPRPGGEHPPETIQAMAAARSSRLATVVADRRGRERGVEWTGGTAIINEDGWIGAVADADGVAISELTLHASGDKSLPPHNDLFGDRRPELY